MRIHFCKRNLPTEHPVYVGVGLFLSFVVWVSWSEQRLLHQPVFTTQTLAISIGSRERPARKNILLTAFVGSDNHCDEDCQATRRALNASTHCAARSLGDHWEGRVVTELSSTHDSGSVANASNRRVLSAWKGPGPFPHFIKIQLLDDLLIVNKDENQLGNESNKTKGDDVAVDWIAWVDADVRVVNMTYPMDKLLEYANQRDAHIIVTSQYSYDTYINNVFFVRNTQWGRRFVQAWKHWTISGSSCGWYDQCPFGVALVQLIQDYQHYQQADEHDLDEILSRPFNETLEIMALRSGKKVQSTILKDELGRITNSSARGTAKSSAPLTIGPVLLIPAWGEETGNEENKDGLLPQSSLSIEPVALFDKIHETTNTWPFAVHSKYSRIFCPSKHATPNVSSLFASRSAAMHQSQCTPNEREQMVDPRAACWSVWPKMAERKQRESGR